MNHLQYVKKKHHSLIYLSHERHFGNLICKKPRSWDALEIIQKNTASFNYQYQFQHNFSAELLYCSFLIMIRWDYFHIYLLQ